MEERIAEGEKKPEDFTKEEFYDIFKQCLPETSADGTTTEFEKVFTSYHTSNFAQFDVKFAIYTTKFNQ